MDTTLLFQTIIGLILILGLLVLMLVVPRTLQKKREKFKEQKIRKGLKSVKEGDSEEYSLEKLHAIIKHKGSTTEDLQNALDLILKFHSAIHKKLGIRTHPDSDIYMDIIFKLCRHKNANKTLIIKFTNNLEKTNPDYKKEINDAMMGGLNSRGL